MPIAGYIRAQPPTIEACIAAARRFAAGWPARGGQGLVLVGSGSSRNALTMSEPAFLRAGLGPVAVHEPRDFMERLAAGAVGQPAVIVLSQGGASTTSIEAARAARAAGLTLLAITAEASSPLRALAPDGLLMPVGNERVGPKTKGFAGSLASLLALAEAFGGPALPAFDAAAFASAIEPARRRAEELAATLDHLDVLFAAGRGAMFGLALEATLKIAEMAGIPAAAFPTEELLHGRLHGLTPRSLALLFAADTAEAAEARRAGDVMRRRGCRLEPVAPGDPSWCAAALATPWNLLGLLLTFQWLGVVLAERRGLRPEAMRHGGLARELAIKTMEPP